eukprot:578230-Ditylum_brightwellii.AAC.1
MTVSFSCLESLPTPAQFVCHKCNKEFKVKAGLSSHLKHCTHEALKASHKMQEQVNVADKCNIASPSAHPTQTAN